MMTTQKKANITAATSCVISILIAKFYFQDYLFLTPCPLCYTERIIIGIIAFFLILSLFRFQLFNLLCALLFCMIGIGTGIRHVWLQSLPPGEAPACGLDFFGTFETMPFLKALKTALTGTGDCAEVQWRFLSLSIPAWVIAFLLVLTIWIVWFNFINKKAN